MKMKAKTKKIIVLSVMVVLLVTTGVLNFVLNDKLTNASENASQIQGETVTETFFAAAKSDRTAMRESEFLILDAIMTSETSSAGAKETAEAQKLELVDRIEKELELELCIKALGYEDVIVTIGDSGATVIVDSVEMTGEQANQIYSSMRSVASFKPTEVKIVPYN